MVFGRTGGTKEKVDRRASFFPKKQKPSAVNEEKDGEKGKAKRRKQRKYEDGENLKNQEQKKPWNEKQQDNRLKIEP